MRQEKKGSHSDLVVIGSGMAATRLAETLRRRGDSRSITLVGAESSLPYNRILLSPLLAGEADWHQLISHSAEWYEDNRIALHLGAPVTHVDTNARTVTAGDDVLSYGHLVFATGAQAARPPLPNIDSLGVVAFRTVDDVTRLQHASRIGGDVVVLGGGLLGLEAAAALAGRSMRVSLVHRAPFLMNRQLDETAAAYLETAMRKRGVDVITGVAPHAIVRSPNDVVAGVRLADGRMISADLVIAAVGIEPATDLARQAGLTVGRGIVVDDSLATSAPAVSAIGECCELNGETVGLVAPIWQQIEVLAARLCGDGPQHYRASPYVTMLKVSGIDVHVMGDIVATHGCRVLAYEDRDWGIYKKLVIRDRHIAGALLFGDVADSQLFFSLVQQRTEVNRDFCRLLLAGELPTEARLATA